MVLYTLFLNKTVPLIVVTGRVSVRSRASKLFIPMAASTSRQQVGGLIHTRGPNKTNKNNVFLS